VVATGFAAYRGVQVAHTYHNVSAGSVTEADAMQPLYRDLAARLRASQPNGEIVLLASPNASTGVGYFGRFKTIGTLYWENLAGLEGAAEIFAARTDEEARALVRARGITHIVVTSRPEFLRDFDRMVRPGASPEDLRTTFGYRLLHEELPPWLEPLPFRPPLVASWHNLLVLPMQVVPDQSEPEALRHLAAAQLAMGDTAGAEASIQRRAAAVAPARRADVLLESAELAYQWHAHGLAVRLYGGLIDLKAGAGAAVNLAWILATSGDDGVRSGPAALSLIGPIASGHPDDAAVLEVLAAALAETGRFREASDAETRAVGRFTDAGDAAAVERARRRLASYNAGQPWRE
jgi:hypothetical protein